MDTDTASKHPIFFHPHFISYLHTQSPIALHTVPSHSRLPFVIFPLVAGRRPILLWFLLLLLLLCRARRPIPSSDTT